MRNNHSLVFVDSRKEEKLNTHGSEPLTKICDDARRKENIAVSFCSF
jgi:hypothetical protein